MGVRKTELNAFYSLWGPPYMTPEEERKGQRMPCFVDHQFINLMDRGVASKNYVDVTCDM